MCHFLPIILVKSGQFMTSRSRTIYAPSDLLMFDLIQEVYGETNKNEHLALDEFTKILAFWWICEIVFTEKISQFSDHFVIYLIKQYWVV